MQYVHLGRSNVKVSRFCLGTMMLGGKTDEAESARITRRAVEQGVNFIDTADVYTGGQCESILGRALEGIRDKVVLASKAGMRVGEGINDEGISRFHYVRAVEASLKRLRTDRLDVFYIHWPTTAMNLDETLRTIDDLVRQGKVLYAACSNFPAWLVMRAQWVADVGRYVPLICGQYPYNLIERGLEIEILPMAQAMNFGITIYRPLAIGVLTGKYVGAVPGQTRGEQDERVGRWTAQYLEGLKKLAAFAADRGQSVGAVASAWVRTHPAISSVIVGVSNLSQLDENVRGFDMELSEGERQTIAGYFGSEVKEEAGGKFPGWRRTHEIGACW